MSNVLFESEALDNLSAVRAAARTSAPLKVVTVNGVLSADKWLRQQAQTRGALIAKLREEVGLSAVAAERLVHVDNSGRTWRQWEAGDRNMDEAKLELFCRKTGQGYPPG